MSAIIFIEYRPIPGFPGYRVGNDGTVWSCKNNRHGVSTIWKQKIAKPRKTGHCYVALHPPNKIGKVKLYGIHNIVLTIFRGACPEGMECLHENGKAFDNRLENLRWGTRQENEADKKRHGTDNSGERNGQAKLTREQVMEIVSLRKQGMAQASIAIQFCVSRGRISAIECGVEWGWLTGASREKHLDIPKQKRNHAIIFCLVQQCGRKHYAKGLCSRHYQQKQS